MRKLFILILCVSMANAEFLKKTTSTVTGTFDFREGGKLYCSTPTVSGEAANKGWVGAQISGGLSGYASDAEVLAATNSLVGYFLKESSAALTYMNVSERDNYMTSPATFTYVATESDSVFTSSAPATYLGITAKAADSELLDGRTYETFVSTGDWQTISGSKTITSILTLDRNGQSELGTAFNMTNFEGSSLNLIENTGTWLRGVRFGNVDISESEINLTDEVSIYSGGIFVDSGNNITMQGVGDTVDGRDVSEDLVKVEGDTMTGALAMSGYLITNISTSPVNNGDASTKGYTDYAIMKATDAIGGGSGDMTKAVYDTDANNVVDNVQKRYVYFSKMGELSSFTGDSWGSDFRLLPDTYTLTKAYIMQGSTGTTDTIIHVGNQDNLEIAAFTIPVGADCVELSTSVVFNKCDIINYHIDDVATPTNLMVWNAGFEDSQTGVAGSSWTELGTAASIGRQSDFAHKGTYSCRFDNLTTSYSGRWIAYSTVTITATETYTVSAWFRTNYATTTNIRLYIDLFDAGNNLVGTVTSGATNLTSDSTWGGISISTTAASNVTQGRLNIDANESINNDAEVWIDRCLVGINIPAISNLAITLELEKQ